MAAEDGAVLGMLMGSVVERIDTPTDSLDATLGGLISESLNVYEDLRKAPTTANVNGALRNRGRIPHARWYHAMDARFCFGVFRYDTGD